MGSAGCVHERSTIIDSRFFADSYSTAQSREIFCDLCRMQRWLDVEAALAICQGELGLIPDTAAQAIAEAADISSIDLDAVAQGIRHSHHSLVSLLGELQRASGRHGEFVHYGATTQDIQDTALALEMRDVLDAVDMLARLIVTRLVEIIESHGATPMVGRTHARPALPITFGLKVAGWLDELLRQTERLGGLRSRCLVAQLGGGAGTLAGLGPKPLVLQQRFAAHLGLGVPRCSWFAARDRPAEFVAVLAMVGQTAGRIADEVRTLSRPEIAEVHEAWSHGQVGSSTMPHKRNPDTSSQAVALARLARAQVALALEAMSSEHERDGRALRTEWVSVADVSHFTLAGLQHVEAMLAGLDVDAMRMRSNLDQVAELVCSERLMFALGERVGKQSAHRLVYDLSQQAQSEGRPLSAVLGERQGHLSGAEIQSVFDPASYVGISTEAAASVADAAARWLGS